MDADRAVCISVNVRRAENVEKHLVKNKIMKISPKLSMAEIVDEAVGETEVNDAINFALDHNKFTVLMSKHESSIKPFNIDPDERFATALEFDSEIKFINFMVDIENDPCNSDLNNNEKSSTDAFQKLMSSVSEVKQKPVIINEEESGRFTAKDKLYNAFCMHLITNECFFPTTMSTVDVKKHVTCVTNTLWYLDGNTQKIMERSVHMPGIIHPVPDRFLQNDFTGYNDWKRKRKPAPTLSQESLKGHSSTLFSLISCKFTSTWGDLRKDLESLAVSLDSYAEYLRGKNEDQVKRQKLDVPPRQVGKDAWMEVRGKTQNIDSKYLLLDQSVRKLENYEYILFSEELHANNMFKSSSQRYHFIERLMLTVPVCMLTYCPGGNLGKVCYIWKVPDNSSNSEILQISMPIYDKLSEYLPEFHTRQMRKDFMTRYNNLSDATNIPKHILRAIYSDLTIDNTAMQNPALDSRVQQAILSEDPDLVLDMRHLNTGRPEDTFSTFFEALNKRVEEMLAVDDRRHGVCHFSEFISVKDLISEVSKLVPKGTPIPSESTVLLSFVPKNSYKKTAKLYTSKVPLQFKVQARQLRVAHPDEHYCAATFKYLKSYAIQYRNNTTFLSVDDKCKVDFGEPGQAVQTGVRGKKAIIPTTSTLAALDHDQQSKGSLTPSVCLKVDIPNDISESFYRGNVFVTYKDSVFESSTPFRHSVETEKILIQSEVKPVLIINSDGGPDHRLTYHSVKLALIVLFKKLGVDMLIAARTAPGHSWVNPAERIMSVLNIALQNCALTREECRSEIEQLLKSANSMSEIRSKATKTPNLKPAWLESVKPIKELLGSRTSRLSLKGVPFSVEEAAEDDEVSETEGSVQTFIDRTVEKGKYQQQHLKSKAVYQKYLADHCRERHYTFQIQKCGDVNCCGPRMHPEQFPWLPDPVLNDDDRAHYKPFADVVGKDTTDSRPSANVSKPKDVAEQLQGIRNDGLIAQNVRKVVTCYECLKPRCLYSRKALSVRDARALSRVMDKHDYCCGAMVLPEGDALMGVVSVRLQMSCQTPVEFAYYASSLGRQDLCAHCAEPGAQKDRDLCRQYKVVLPVCVTCINMKRNIPKRNPYK